MKEVSHEIRPLHRSLDYFVSASVLKLKYVGIKSIEDSIVCTRIKSDHSHMSLNDFRQDCHRYGNRNELIFKITQGYVGIILQ